MAKDGGGVYKIVEVVGISKTSWEDAGRKAVEVASKSLRDLRVAEVIKTDMKVENGKVTAYRTRVSLSFKYEAYASWGSGGSFIPAERIRADFDKFAERRFIIGSESQVVDQIGRYGETTGTDHILLRVQWPGLDQKTVVGTLERLGRVVEQLK